MCESGRLVFLYRSDLCRHMMWGGAHGIWWQYVDFLKFFSRLPLGMEKMRFPDNINPRNEQPSTRRYVYISDVSPNSSGRQSYEGIKASRGVPESPMHTCKVWGRRHKAKVQCQKGKVRSAPIRGFSDKNQKAPNFRWLVLREYLVPEEVSTCFEKLSIQFVHFRRVFSHPPPLSYQKPCYHS